MAVVVVFGMHRSGTSCLTRMLQQAGMFLGHDLMDDLACSNLEGHAEAHKAVRINDRLLELSGGAWDRVPASLRGDEETAAHMRAFLQILDAHPVAGWKDPRTTLTFPLWKPHLPAYHLVACVRHPLAVAHSLQVRDGWPLDKGLALWATYNERLLEHLAGEADVSWFHFDLPRPELTGQVQALCRRLDLPVEGVGETFNPYLRHHVCSERVDDASIQALYERLLEKAGRQVAVCVKAGSAPAPHDLRLAQLARVQQLQNELQQQQTRWLDDLRRMVIHIQDHVNHRETSWQAPLGDQQKALEEVQRRQASVYQELERHGSHFQREFNRHWIKFHQVLADQHRQAREVMTQLEAMIRRLTDGLSVQVAGLQTRNQELEAILAQWYGFIERVRASLPFRCRRLFRACLRLVSAQLRPWVASPAAPSSDLARTRQAARRHKSAAEPLRGCPKSGQDSSFVIVSPLDFDDEGRAAEKVGQQQAEQTVPVT
jgi:hypothetical protein